MREGRLTVLSSSWASFGERSWEGLVLYLQWGEEERSEWGEHGERGGPSYCSCLSRNKGLFMLRTLVFIRLLMVDKASYIEKNITDRSGRVSTHRSLFNV